MSLSEILEEVAKLSPLEKQSLRSAMQPANDADISEEDKIEKVLQEMLRTGMISRIPNRRKMPRKSSPISIKGEPISETIIRERR